MTDSWGRAVAGGLQQRGGLIAAGKEVEVVAGGLADETTKYVEVTAGGGSRWEGVSITGKRGG